MRYHIPCRTCNGEFETIVHQPKFCQIEDCSLPREHKCTGYFCKGEGWVCDTHWKQEEIGFSDSGYACISLLSTEVGTEVSLNGLIQMMIGCLIRMK